MATTPEEVDALMRRGYQHGFVTELEADTVPPGLDEDVIRLISRKKKEPGFMLDWRLAAFAQWQTMKEPRWANVDHPAIDLQAFLERTSLVSDQDGYDRGTGETVDVKPRSTPGDAPLNWNWNSTLIPELQPLCLNITQTRRPMAGP